MRCSHDNTTDYSDEPCYEDYCTEDRLGDDSLCWKELYRFLDREARIKSHLLCGPERNDRAHPPKIQGHHEHKMRGEYDQEVPRRVLHDGS